MARNYYINGESMVMVKGGSGSAISETAQLGLSDGPIRISIEFRHKDIQVDAFGGEVPPEVQWMLASATISMTLVHFDIDVLEACIQESMSSSAADGTMSRAGELMGGGVDRFGAGWSYISLGILSPVASEPWRFYASYLTGNPITVPLGIEKSLVQMNWRAIPYQLDPWGNGTGAQGAILYDHGTD